MEITGDKMIKLFIPPTDFDVLELECDQHNLVQFQMLGKVLKRQEKDLDTQLVAIGRRLYLKRYGMHLSSTARARKIANNYIEERQCSHTSN